MLLLEKMARQDPFLISCYLDSKDIVLVKMAFPDQALHILYFTTWTTVVSQLIIKSLKGLGRLGKTT